MSRSAQYREQRNYENLQKAMYYGTGPYGIPTLYPVKEIDVDKWISFNFAKTATNTERTGVHFWLDDYQFERVWRNPELYTRMLARFSVVCTPDFSPYSDFPKAIQLYNHYRKHWCGAYWQDHGLTVIPTISWSSPDTLEWCFDGEPVGGVVATSAVGMLSDKEGKKWLLDGYAEMIRRLEPAKVIWKGKVPEELKGEMISGRIQRITSFTDKWRTVDGTRETGV